MVVTDLSRRHLMAAGGGILLAGALPMGVNMTKWERDSLGAGVHRYKRAEEFFSGLSSGPYRDRRDLLYRAGIVAQLGITAFLLERGATDEWCRQHVGLHVDKALAIANSWDLNHRHPDMLVLANHLSPYGVWRQPGAADLPRAVVRDPQDVSETLSKLLASVHRALRPSGGAGTGSGGRIIGLCGSTG